MLDIAEFYNKLSEKEQKIFYAAIAVLVLAFFDVLFLRPVLSRLDKIKTDVKTTTIAIERDIRFIAYRDKIMAEDKVFRKFETDESKSGEEIIGGFLKTIEVLASDAKINLSRVTPADVVPKKGFVQYFANVDCNGKLEDMVTFMHNIDVTDNLLKIVRMNMTGNKASKEEVKVEMKVAKLVIDPATIGNYAFDSREIKMPQELLDEAAAELGLPGFKLKKSKDSVQNLSGTKPTRGLLSGDGSASSSGLEKRPAGGSGSGGGKGTGLVGKSEAVSGDGTGTGAASAEGSDSGSGGGKGDGLAGKSATGSGASLNAGSGKGIRGGIGAEEGGVKAEPGAEDIYLGGAGTVSKRDKRNDKNVMAPTEKASEEQPAPAKEMKAIPSQGRVRVDSLETLWGKFADKLFGRSAAPEGGDEYVDAESAPPDERNLWERKIR